MELTRITKGYVSNSSLVELPKIIPVIWLSIWISKFPIATFLRKVFLGSVRKWKFFLDILNINCWVDFEIGTYQRKTCRGSKVLPQMIWQRDLLLIWHACLLAIFTSSDQNFALKPLFSRLIGFSNPAKKSMRRLYILGGSSEIWVASAPHAFD